MMKPKLARVLCFIAKSLHQQPINWALTGSCSLALQGVEVSTNDIDIQTDAQGAYEIESLFSEYIVEKVSFKSTDRMKSHLGKLVIDQVEVEVMGDIQKRVDDGEWEEPVNLQKHQRWVELDNILIPVLSLEYEYEAYQKMGRIQKAELIKQCLEQKNQMNEREE